MDSHRTPNLICIMPHTRSIHGAHLPIFRQTPAFAAVPPNCQQRVLQCRCQRQSRPPRSGNTTLAPSTPRHGALSRMASSCDPLISNILESGPATLLGQ
ncbi:uncharacterized protein CANTADRAFT_133120 [Suhomyces tanzawaensis NRRL Y-17324]|uniref:Uncharacterized protein n=1 Tax=Suhomyces tanzawaensis NRRL Y-17324 TaxID=984487 RepID=A0A1E4SRD3_9ASCO|nr:uncharacterized protein CANTADRAFT_133120 [Suhomyces tanzawaensis NRRL Y-17324]ODV82061.1 hypothetical protein CANTADRAFT_133120 [Suhomyces tanzawaensis NRRL Y-17324]